jgi:hypothetical protein
MEQLRIRKKNEINIKINELKSSIQRLNKAVENYQKDEIKFEDLEVENTFKEKRKIDYEKQIVEKEALIDYLKNEIVRVEQGELDEELKRLNQVSKNNNNKNSKKAEQKVVKPIEEIKNYTRSRQLNIERIRQSYLREWNNYTFSQQTLPEYMRKNLKEMTQNKGYIWKGCWFMGEIDSDCDSIITLFEKPNKDCLFIHEYNKEKRIYSLYEKSGQNYKKLILKKPF